MRLQVPLRERFLDTLIDGLLGRGLVVRRREFMRFFAELSSKYTGVFLSNSEMLTGQHSPTYDHFTMRIGRGVYRVHPNALSQRMRERGLLRRASRRTKRGVQVTISRLIVS
jgi:hypothetical protein